MPPEFELLTPRLRLRPYRLDDLPAMFAVFGDEGFPGFRGPVVEVRVLGDKEISRESVEVVLGLAEKIMLLLAVVAVRAVNMLLRLGLGVRRVVMTFVVVLLLDLGRLHLLGPVVVVMVARACVMVIVLALLGLGSGGDMEIGRASCRERVSSPV